LLTLDIRIRSIRFTDRLTIRLRDIPSISRPAHEGFGNLVGTLTVDVSKYHLILVIDSVGVGQHTRCIADTTPVLCTFFRCHMVAFKNFLLRYCRGFDSNIV